MLALLNPRLLILLAVLAALAVSHYTMFRKGKAHVRTEWLAATASANTESRRLEQLRQSAADAAARNSATRSARILADAASAGDSVARLRDAIRARRSAEESAAAATQRADSLGELLAASAEAHRELATRCDRHVNDLRTLLEAWPK